MDRLVSVDTKELLLYYTHQHRHDRRHPRNQGAKPSSTRSPPQGPQRRRHCSAALRVTNLMHTMSVAVHLSTTRPSSFSFSPSSALVVLPPLASSSFSLHYLARSPSPVGVGEDDGADSSSPPLSSPPDAVVVRSALLPTGKADAADLRRLFSGPPAPQIFTDARIPISFVGPDALLALLRLSSPCSPSSAAPLTLDTAFLLSKAASVCSPSELSALLLRAASVGNPRFVSALLDAGAEPNQRDGAGKSALSIAVAAGSLETVEVLLDAGAVVDSALDRLIVHEAAAKNRVDLMGAVADLAGAAGWPDSMDSAGRTPLHVAAAHGNLDATRFCLSSSSSSGSCDPDHADAEGWTPLHHAAAGGFLEVARLLLGRCSYAAKYALTADTRKTPFDLAVDAAGSHDDAHLLLGLLRLDDLLHRAAAVGDTGGVRSCLARGAAVDGRDQNGWTPLHRAAFKGRAEVVEILIDHGAEVDAADDAGWTPLRCAGEAGRDEVALLLVARGAARTGLKGLEAAKAKSESDTIPGPRKSPHLLLANGPGLEIFARFGAASGVPKTFQNLSVSSPAAVATVHPSGLWKKNPPQTGRLSAI